MMQVAEGFTGGVMVPSTWSILYWLPWHCQWTVSVWRLPQEWPYMPANALGCRLLEDLARMTGGQSVAVVREWERKHGPLTDGVVSWPAWAPLAKALSLGSWPSDVTVWFRRCATG